MPRMNASGQRTTLKTGVFFLSSGHEVSVYRAQGLENIVITDLEGQSVMNTREWRRMEGEERREDRRWELTLHHD